MNYPELKYGNIELELITDSIIVDGLLQEANKDLKYRFNTNVTYTRFKSSNYEDNWQKEYYFIKKDNSNVGFICIDYERWERIASFYLSIAPKFQHFGIALKASIIGLKIVFEIMGCNKLEGVAFEYNKESLKIQKKFMKLEGIRRKNIFFMGKYWDTYLFGLLREEYFKSDYKKEDIK